MIEILPKLRYWHSLDPDLRRYPLLVGDQVLQFPSLLEALELCCHEPDIRILNHGQMYTVGHLLHINAPSACVFNLRGWEEERVTDTRVRPQTIHDWRRRVGLDNDRSVRGGRRLF